ncbi:hypothetical protein [Sphaerobacter thermophilus]|uniref:Uncharacterized protein n=1 Tax=Sphaerobacter thermophilus (strain ATCC 49802 / DSM 20745 / KCCM 41009 / NCIMB 13125 / S 6022) TaxID=479434 RepID=D1C6I3_SPHTD|nr:hypothetical protein [Sphaerobacter thermophilus]ACZ39608.1 hypothetical protein Sthe_2182 [Sphaerobacter thermophilus DSM 20745]PZN64773.1 MAG: hypothetical protein DIU58_08425 [Sphaerobacter thermophilus]
MAGSTAAIVQRLRALGFQTYYETTAIYLLTHPDLPGLEVRIGTTIVTFERDGREVYRAPIARFDLETALARAGWRGETTGGPEGA